jgi:hypothetical protein
MKYKRLRFHTIARENSRRFCKVVLNRLTFRAAVCSCLLLAACKKVDQSQVPDAQTVIIATPSIAPDSGLAATLKVDAGKTIDPYQQSILDEIEKEEADYRQMSLNGYLKDCRFVPRHADEGIEDPYYDIARSDCEFGPEYGQNCEPESSNSGCPGPEACWSGCPIGCQMCEDKCENPCSQCKDKCGQDANCTLRCAQERLACHEKCVKAMQTCRYDCEFKDGICERKFEEKRDKRCPDCNAMGSCAGNQKPGDGYYKKCQELLKRNPKECVSWCAP